MPVRLVPSPKALLDVMVENIIVEGYGQRERPDRLPAREASSTHGHVSGGKRQGLEAGWMYEEGPMWWLRATSRPAPHPGSEDLVLRQHQLDPVDQLRRG